MFFLAFILFALLIAWLVINGLNEMRWVQAHSDDDEVAADPGIIPTRSDLMDARTKIKEKTQAAMQDDGVLGKAKQKVQDSGYLDKAKEIGKGAGDKLKDAGSAVRSKSK